MHLYEKDPLAPSLTACNDNFKYIRHLCLTHFSAIDNRTFHHTLFLERQCLFNYVSCNVTEIELIDFTRTLLPLFYKIIYF